VTKFLSLSLSLSLFLSLSPDALWPWDLRTDTNQVLKPFGLRLKITKSASLVVRLFDLH
jgi:hypothetical protein